MTAMLVFEWALRIIAAVILLQTLFFKFRRTGIGVHLHQSRRRALGSHRLRRG